MLIVPAYPDAIPTDAEWEDTLIGGGGGDTDGNLINRQSYFVAQWHNKVKREIQATDTELGLLPKGDHSSVRARLDYLDTVWRSLPEEANPNINIGQYWMVSGTIGGPFTILDFPGPRASGHMLVLSHIDDQVTISHNNNIHLAGNVDKTPVSGDITLLFHDLHGEWKEATSRSGGGIPKDRILAWDFKMVDIDNYATPLTGLTVAVTISQDGSAFTTLAGSPAVSEIEYGWYTIAVSAADMNYDRVILRATANGAAQNDRSIYPI